MPSNLVPSVAISLPSTVPESSIFPANVTFSPISIVMAVAFALSSIPVDVKFINVCPLSTSRTVSNGNICA